MPLSIAFVLPYGEPSDGFFPDTLLGQLCTEARLAGHSAHMLRAYYDGRDRERDREIATRIRAWLGERDVDLVVVERLFDPEPIRAHVAAAPKRRAMMICRGESFDPVDGIDYVVGATPGPTRSGRTRRTPRIADLLEGFRAAIGELSEGRDPGALPGVARVDGDSIAPCEPLPRSADRVVLRPAVDHDVISPGPAPRVIRKTLWGDVGCPFSDDPLDNPHYRGLALPVDQPVAQLGCAFCTAGGDYEKRPDDAVVDELVEQALYLQGACPDLEELVLADQYPLRYLERLVQRAHERGVKPTRWLFASRPDSFVRERERLDSAVAAAEATGHVLEVYLSGFEAFSDRELGRYNKGVSVGVQLEAVRAMRQLTRAHPRAFSYARARGHSLILWNPWTSVDDVAESVRVIREHGLAELFHDMGRNRLRLYKNLPIYYAAQRDGALTTSWDEGDDGAGRRKGYNVEQPWRFLDSRTRIAYELSRALCDRLGHETEPGQLSAALVFARGADDTLAVSSERARVVREIEALARALEQLCAPRGEGGPRRADSELAAVVSFAGACNNHCAACANADEQSDDDEQSVLARVETARASGRWIALAGREPTIHPAFLRAVARARGPDARGVAVVGNGRRFSYERFAQKARRAGLVSASIKVFAPDASVADAISRAPDGYAQTLAGLDALAVAGVTAREIRIPLHRDNLARIERYAQLAHATHVTQLRVECALDAVGLDRLDAAREAVERLAEACAREGVALEASTLRAGTREFTKVPGIGADPRLANRGAARYD